MPLSRLPHPQDGVVLIIALILLVVISLLAVASVRNAGSTASVSGNVRTTELATQAAEIALLHCESSVLKVLDSTSTYATTFKLENILPASTPPQWQNTAVSWDIAATQAFVLPPALVNQPGMTDATYSRPPECMVEFMDSTTSSTTGDTTSYYVVTARGFGPEVEAAAASRSRPVGSEVWLQSHISILDQNHP